MVLKRYLKTIQIGKKIISSSKTFQDGRTIEKGMTNAKFAQEALPHAPLCPIPCAMRMPSKHDMLFAYFSCCFSL